IIGKEIWSEYLGLEIEGNIPPLPQGIHQTVRSDRRRLAGEKEGPTCAAILMPKGLTVNKLIELAINPKNGHSTKMDYIDDEIIAELGDKAVEESYWFVMTDIIEKSNHKNVEAQKKLLKEKTNNDYELPIV